MKRQPLARLSEVRQLLRGCCVLTRRGRLSQLGRFESDDEQGARRFAFTRQVVVAFELARDLHEVALFQTGVDVLHDAYGVPRRVVVDPAPALAPPHFVVALARRLALLAHRRRSNVSKCLHFNVLRCCDEPASSLRVDTRGKLLSDFRAVAMSASAMGQALPASRRARRCRRASPPCSRQVHPGGAWADGAEASEQSRGPARRARWTRARRDVQLCARPRPRTRRLLLA